MQKRLFFLFFCCLSANAWAQRVDTVALIGEVLKTYTNTKFLDTIKPDNSDISEYLVFFTHPNVQKNTIKNAYIWDKKQQNFEIMDIEMLKIFNTNTRYKAISVNLTGSKNNTLYVYFGTTIKIEHAPPIFNKIDILLDGRTPETDTPICYNTTTLPNGETQIITPTVLRIIEIPSECDRLGNSIYNVQDAQFTYNPSTKKYEIQPFQRQNERRKWFAQNFLIDQRWAKK